MAQRALELLSPIPLEQPLPDATVRELIQFSENVRNVAMQTSRFNFRRDGLLRRHGLMLDYSDQKTTKDVLIRQCKNPECASWLHLRPDWRNCYSCGMERSEEEESIVWTPPLAEDEAKGLEALIRAADNKLHPHQQADAPLFSIQSASIE